MQALQTQPHRATTPKPLPQKRSYAYQAEQRKSQRNHALIAELSLKTTVNCVILGVVVATAINLLPHQTSQQKKLAELQTEVAEAEYRVNQLREDFNRNFDAYQSIHLMQEKSTKIHPLQKKIIWIDPQASGQNLPGQ